MFTTKRHTFLKRAGAARLLIGLAALLVLAAPVLAQTQPPTFKYGDYCTFTQGGWGAVPHGNNPGMILSNNFTNVYPLSLYPSGVVVGKQSAADLALYSMTFTSALAIQNYLPAGGKPNALMQSVFYNPNPAPGQINTSGVFGGQVLALQLNVNFSDPPLPISPPFPVGFGNLFLSNTGTSLDRLTVSQILDVANLALGDGPLPPDYSIPSLNDLISFLNQGFDNCYPSGWVQDHLMPSLISVE